MEIKIYHSKPISAIFYKNYCKNKNNSVYYNMTIKRAGACTTG